MPFTGARTFMYTPASGRSYITNYGRANILQNLTDAALAFCTDTGNYSSVGWVAERAGRLVAAGIHANGNSGGGNATLNVWVNGASVASWTWTSGQAKATTDNLSVAYAAGDVFLMRITTPAGWSVLTLEAGAWFAVIPS